MVGTIKPIEGTFVSNDFMEYSWATSLTTVLPRWKNGQIVAIRFSNLPGAVVSNRYYSRAINYGQNRNPKTGKCRDDGRPPAG